MPHEGGASAVAESNGGPIADYHDREAWLEERGRSIGGSEIAAIYGEHPFVTPRELWERKTGRAGESEVTLAMERGRALEDIAAERYEIKTGRRTRKVPLKRRDGHPFLHASADRQILAGTGEGEWYTPVTLAGELKVPGWRVFSEVRSKGLRPYMILQGQLEAWVFDYPAVSFGLLHADSFRDLAFDLEADPDVQEQIVNDAGEWWEKYVVGDTPPPEETEDIDLPEVEGEIVQVSGQDWRRAAQEYLEADELYQAAKDLRNDAKDQLKELMPGYGAAEGAGVRAYLQRQEGRTSWKKTAQALATASGLEIEPHIQTGNPFDRFTIYDVGEGHDG